MSTITRNFARLAASIDVGPALAELAANEPLWAEFTLRQEYPGSAHGDTECIVLRGPFSWAGAFTDLVAIDSPNVARLPAVAEVLVQAARLTRSESLGRVMVVRLKPGGVITPHVDEGAYAEHYARFHLVLDADQPGNVFTCGGASVSMAAGELWWFDHRQQHTVTNGTDRPRTHLIFDVRRPRFLTIDQEPIADIIESELWPLLVEHREELTTNKALMKLAPDTARYRDLEAAGSLCGLVVRDEARAVAGYSVNFIAPHLHYSECVAAHNDVLFLRRDHRQGTLGLRLLRATEDACRAHGAALICWHAKPGTSLEQILRRRAYRVQDVIFSKEL